MMPIRCASDWHAQASSSANRRAPTWWESNASRGASEQDASSPCSMISGSGTSRPVSGTRRGERNEVEAERFRHDVDAGGRRAAPSWASAEAYFGCATVRRYGFSVLKPCGYFFLASSSDTDVGMMTSWPGFQFTGVATTCLAVNWHESRRRSTSSKLRPVLIGYTIIALTFLSGPTMNTERTVALSTAVRLPPVALGWIMS